MPASLSERYRVVCEFEPRKHYDWTEAILESGRLANTLVIRFPNKGNPQHLDSSSWSLADDPAFGSGLETVRQVLEEVDRMPGDSFDSNWQRFFRSQMRETIRKDCAMARLPPGRSSSSNGSRGAPPR